MTTLIQDQIDREMLQYSLAARNKISKVDRQIKSRQEYNTTYGKQAVLILVDAAEKNIASRYGKRNQHTSRFYWNHIKPRHEAGETPERTMAEMVAITLVSTLSKDMTLTKTAGKMAKNAFHIFNVEHDERVELDQYATQFFAALIEHLAEVTDIFVSEQVNNREYRLSLSDKWADNINKEKDNTKTNIDSYSPMTVKPLKHTNLTSGKGGYLKATSPLLKRPVKKSGRVVKSVRDFTDKTAPDYFAFINRVQETPYCVNTKLLNILDHYYAMGMIFNDYPVDINEDLAKADAAKEIETRNKARLKWHTYKGTEYTPLTEGTVRKVESEYYNREEQRCTKTLALLDQAEEFSTYEAIYYPIFVDNRGRMYPYASGCLSYQGDEMSKALLHFANKKEINTDGVDSLFETLANTLKDENGMGLDKRVLADKSDMAAKWFGEHQEAFMNGDWSLFFTEQNSFEEPVTALAICIELVEFIKDPSYKTGIICHRDARVSGSSIIGTALRDKEVMEMTSVLDWSYDGFLGDAYTTTALSALKMCLEKAEAGDELAEGILCFKDVLFTRKVFKHVVMTFCSYGLTEHSLREYNSEQLDWKEELSLKHKKLFDEIMIEALAVALPACDAYLKKAKMAGGEVAKRDGMIAFTNPLSKFPVAFTAKRETVRTIEVRQPFKLIQLKISTPTNTPDTRKMGLATAPNIVHALDSSLLYLVETKAQCELALIHDSVGSHPNDTHSSVCAYAQAMRVLAISDVFNDILEQMKVEHRIELINTATNADIMMIEHSKHVLC
ncbi:MAG: DNA-directed RNA polymerase [Cetobacterium sp.]|uniref:DNA-directed RNA polymerase n=1 Tax=Cetobacterium sp. TaxID=2071632 RepID=UPI003EE5E5EF